MSRERITLNFYLKVKITYLKYIFNKNKLTVNTIIKFCLNLHIIKNIDLQVN
jgi:hypothetical protein